MEASFPVSRRIDARIDAVYGELPPQERRVADFLLEHLGDLAIFSAADISRETGVSKATVSRIFRKLGFGSFGEVREHVRELRHRGIPTVAPVSSGDNAGATALQRHEAQERENLSKMVQALEGGRLQQAVQLISSANRVTIVGLRNGFPLALHLRQQLTQIRGDVGLVPFPGQSMGEELAGLQKGDLVIALGFRRRPALFGKVVERTAAIDAGLLLIGDSTARHYAGKADAWIECPQEADGAFDSYAAAMSLISILANGVLNVRHTKGHRRISRISAAYEEMGELEEL
ncbi:MurR/RpiR family transcriptional regulator [Nesterenkonia populi]|uniref:MurR/RpiR family transcriptional regulator n=1 Tax=Nesterenkonia populi TaxID=1591087 RepID=UPI0011BFA2B1|nr:MurR/RpiR family transcriptional regulator [Nesterenkonia populi]